MTRKAKVGLPPNNKKKKTAVDSSTSVGIKKPRSGKPKKATASGGNRNCAKTPSVASPPFMNHVQPRTRASYSKSIHHAEDICIQQSDAARNKIKKTDREEKLRRNRIVKACVAVKAGNLTRQAAADDLKLPVSTF